MCENDYILSKTIITKVKKNKYWFDYDYNMNLYRGCNHNCIYCDSRSEIYNIDNFSKVKYKKNAVEILNKELKTKREKGVIATGAMSDPYNKLEETINLTRDALKVIKSNGFGVFIMTKSDLIMRDIDILKEIKEHTPVVVAMTITSFDDDIAKIIEPFAPSTSRRFKALERLKSEGIYAGIMLMPILPFINDSEENISKIINKSKEINLDFIYPLFGVTLRDNQREYYFDKLDRNFPNLKHKYIKTYGNNYYCEVKNKKNLEEIFGKLNKNNEIITDIEKINIDYRSRYKMEQLSLFNFNKEV